VDGAGLLTVAKERQEQIDAVLGRFFSLAMKLGGTDREAAA
jgi:hypothetical protein